MELAAGTARYRTLFLSDLHLGMRGCQAGRVLDFLRRTESDRLYLVGDIVDGWALKRAWTWAPVHDAVVQELFRKARTGTTVVFVPGNHDDFARPYAAMGGMHVGGIEVRREALHETADGRRLLILHGDEFDGVVRFARWLSTLGARAYEAALAVNTVVAAVRERMGYPYWSLAAFLKARAKKAVQYIAEFEAAVARTAAERGVDGIVCGHIHAPELRRFPGGTLYANCGDWVENCTALAEHADGRLEIIRWDTRLTKPEARLTHAGDGAAGDGHPSALPSLDALRLTPSLPL